MCIIPLSSFNPNSNGSCSESIYKIDNQNMKIYVSILILMEVALKACNEGGTACIFQVSILILMEVALKDASVGFAFFGIAVSILILMEVALKEANIL